MRRRHLLTGTRKSTISIGRQSTTLKSYNTQISFAEYSSSNLMDPFRNDGVHPGDARYQHTYCIHLPANSNESVLLPSYDFRGGGGFPNRNALTTPCPAPYTYTHPSPLPKSHPHPSTAHLLSLQDRPPTQRPMPNTGPTSAARGRSECTTIPLAEGQSFLPILNQSLAKPKYCLYVIELPLFSSINRLSFSFALASFSSMRGSR